MTLWLASCERNIFVIALEIHERHGYGEYDENKTINIAVRIDLMHHQNAYKFKLPQHYVLFYQDVYSCEV